MAALQEVHSFIHKFMNLYSNGKNANLSMQCNDGRVTIDLQLHLYHPPPPPYYQTPPPRPHPQPCQQGVSPSRLRRSKRRAHARAEKARSDVPDIANNFDATENAATFTNPNKNTTEEAEQAVVSFTDKSDLQHPEAHTAEQADIQKDNYNAAKATKSIENMSEENSAEEQPKNLICYFCDKGFENEDLIKDHTEIEHNSRRVRIKRI